MISEPIEDFKQACDAAEAAASDKQIDYAVVMKNISVIPTEHQGWYYVIAMVNLDVLTTIMPSWNLIVIYDPQGVAYSWSS